MKRALTALALLVAGAGVANAQITKAIDKARGAKAAADAHIAREQNAQAQAQGKKGAKPAPQKSVEGTAQGTGTHGKVGPNGRVTHTAKLDTVPSYVMRESFDYDREGARDPFVSLLNTSELRPVLADLHLIGILYDANGRRSVAIMRDQTNQLYRATVGQTLGRMRVAQIKPRSVIFTIEEFGFNRQDSLVLADTTKARTP
ncbi:MAG: hypothetical protein KGL93_05575 [Gemmatimonadota bacterium]|nr:hypothetical protein [Gemmatimonadota bacterium]HEU4988300.1 hypothetical protein [Gemmatimonadaceae bacterium]